MLCLLFLKFLTGTGSLFGASLMSSKLRMKRMTSLVSFLTGATRTLHRNLAPEIYKEKTSIPSRVKVERKA